MRRALRTLLSGLVVVLVAANVSLAQVGSTAQITGTVKDTSGAVLPGVDVTATQTGHGLQAIFCDRRGAAITRCQTCPSVRTVSKWRSRGSARTSQTGIVLQVNANPVIPVTLSLGDLNETISVVGATPLVETRTASIGTVIENERIEELPLNGRQATDLIILAGAAVPRRGRDKPQHAGWCRNLGRGGPGVRRGVSAGWRHSQQSLRQSEPAAAVP